MQSIQKCVLAFIKYIAKALQKSKFINASIDNVKRRTKMDLVENDKNSLNKITKRFKFPELYKLSENYFWEENMTKLNWKDMFRKTYTLLLM